MLRWVLDLSRVRKARKAACAAISPMVARSRARLGAIPDATWSNPYIVGFIVMLISIIAKMEIGKIDGQALCHVQIGAWQQITGHRSDLIGEEVMLLSASRNQEFETGCHDALALASLLISSSVLGDRPIEPDLDINAVLPWPERDDLSSLWERFFEAHISISASDHEAAYDKTPLEFS